MSLCPTDMQNAHSSIAAKMDICTCTAESFITVRRKKLEREFIRKTDSFQVLKIF